MLIIVFGGNDQGMGFEGFDLKVDKCTPLVPPPGSYLACYLSFFGT